MKKITITSAILLAGTVLVNAQVDGAVTVPVAMPAVAPQMQRQAPNQKQVRENMIKRPVAQTLPPQGENKNSEVRENSIQGQGPIPMTGDSVTDTKIRALIAEMDAKIKAIRDDYQSRIKTVIGNRKIVNNGTSTRPMMPKGPESDSPRFGSSTRPVEGRDNQDNRNERGDSPQNIGSSTDYRNNFPRRDGGEVRGTNTENVGQAVGDGVTTRFKNFFRGMMGGN